jgi:calcium channel MID1
MLALLISCISLSLSLETTVSGNGHAQDVPLFPLQHQNNHEDVALKKDGSGAVAYEALFSTLGRSLLGPRQDSSDTSELLKNNQRAAVTISPGEIQLFKFPSEEFLKSKWAGEPSLPPSQAAIERDEHVELKRRQSDAREIFLSLSVCGQPTPSSEKTQMPPPALELYVSSPGACSPGPDSKDTAQTKLSVVEGLAKYNEDRSDDLCVAVRAPAASGFTGSYDFEIAASVDTYYSNYYDHQSLYLLDSDAKAGLFVSTNLTNPVTTDQDAIGKWHATDSPFSIFLYSKNDSSISGLTNSFCALNRTAQIKGIGGSSSDQTVDMSMTTIGDYRKAGTAKQLFYVPDLNASSSYYAIIGLSSNYSRSASNPPTAGGTVWKAIEFDTKSCKIIL